MQCAVEARYLSVIQVTVAATALLHSGHISDGMVRVSLNWEDTMTQSHDNRIMTDVELNAITGGEGGYVVTDKPGITANMTFGDQKLTVFASADVHGLVWSPR